MYKINPELETKLINTPDELSLDKTGDVPTLCFSISILGKDEDEQEKIGRKVLRYSHQFCKNNFNLVSQTGLNYSNLWNLSLLAVSWSRINFKDNDILYSSAEQASGLISTVSHESAEEICKILWSYNTLNYTNEYLACKVFE